MGNVIREFNDVGEKITIQLRYEDLEVSELPESCNSCPIGFRKHNCGCKFPIGAGRPETCKLKLVNSL